MISTRHDYGNCKYLSKRTIADKVLRNKAFNIAKNLKYDGYQRERASLVCNLFDKETSSIKKGTKVNSDIVFESN